MLGGNASVATSSDNILSVTTIAGLNILQWNGTIDLRRIVVSDGGGHGRGGPPHDPLHQWHRDEDGDEAVWGPAGARRPPRQGRAQYF